MWCPNIELFFQSHFLHWNAILVGCISSDRLTSRAETVGALFHHTRRGSSTSQSPPDSRHVGPSPLCPQEKPRSATGRWHHHFNGMWAFKGSSWINLSKLYGLKPLAPRVVHIRIACKWKFIPWKTMQAIVPIGLDLSPHPVISTGSLDLPFFSF